MCWRCDSNAHHPFTDSTEDTSHRWENPTRTGGVAHRGTLRNRSTPSVFCTLIVSHFKGFVKRFFELFCSVGRFCFTSPNYALGRGCSLLSASFVPLLYHNLGGLSRGFLKFLLRKLRAGRLGHTQPLPTVRHLAWVSQLPEVFPPLDTNSIPHPSPDCNRQNVQNRDFYFLDICATFLLTKCWRYVIMEIPAPTTEGAAPKN